MLILVMSVALTGFCFQNNRTITGTVIAADDHLPIPGVTVKVKGTTIGTQTNTVGKYTLAVPASAKVLQVSFIGYQTQEIAIGNSGIINITLANSQNQLAEVVVSRGLRITPAPRPVGYYGPTIKSGQARDKKTKLAYGLAGRAGGLAKPGTNADNTMTSYNKENEESYKGFVENSFINPKNTPLSTFSVDVDAASYSNFRRFINNGELPPPDAVRIEEMINYFRYNLAGPTNSDPVAIHTELSSAPWNPAHRLLRIALKAKTIANDKLPACNLVFLIDVSGSMGEPNKLPLVKSSLKMLADQLRPKDKVALVVYAGAAGVVLPSTSGDKKAAINNAIDNLEAGGSTAGGAGIKLAYRIAMDNLIKQGNNRIILATDGDFNVGASSDDDMQKLIEQKRESGISLSVLGYGMGNYKDSKMETLADKGNGNYAYIDNITEARKTLISEFGGTLFTVAKDVKLQIEFNPVKVKAYRLLGYENRILDKEDFNNDKKDAGDMGSGHNVTAFYEIIPVGATDNYTGSVDALKYQKPVAVMTVGNSDEMLTIKFRYKEPTSMRSKLSMVTVADKPLSFDKTTADFRFATAVAEAGMVLRDSQFKQKSSFVQAITIAKAARGDDAEGYRAEFIRLAESARLLAKTAMVKQGDDK